MATVDKTTTRKRFAETFGLPKDTTAAKVLPYMSEYVQEFINNAPFAFPGCSR